MKTPKPSTIYQQTADELKLIKLNSELHQTLDYSF